MEFISAYSGLLSHVPFELDSKLLDEQKNIEDVYLASCGCIGILRDLISDALSGLAENQELKAGHILSNAMHPSELMGVWREIAEGREFFDKRGEFDEVREYLGINSNQKGTNKSANEKKSRRRPGERNPKRDPIGV
ncbi:MAG: hypothetical protein V7720_16080 [Halioglobus sp.]